jgi:hypothetical protein
MVVTTTSSSLLLAQRPLETLLSGDNGCDVSPSAFCAETATQKEPIETMARYPG